MFKCGVRITGEIARIDRFIVLLMVNVIYKQAISTITR
ncbi:RNA chaperone Hfq [Bacillus cereus]